MMEFLPNKSSDEPPIMRRIAGATEELRERKKELMERREKYFYMLDHAKSDLMYRFATRKIWDLTSEIFVIGEEISYREFGKKE